MKEVKIPKKTKGQFRTIVVLDDEELKNNRNYLKSIYSTHSHLISDCCHGFVVGKNAVTNAQQHVKYRYSLCLDLKDFFDSVKPEHVSKILGDKIIHFFYKDRAAQGMPSSPFIANLAARNMDEGILSKLPDQAVYTRYADDLTVSFNDINQLDKIKNVITTNVGRNGFKINKSKTRLLDGGYYNRVITGVSIPRNSHKLEYVELKPTRASRRKLRAAKHNVQKTKTKIFFQGSRELFKSLLSQRCKVRGFQEWHKMKAPTLSLKNINLESCQSNVIDDAKKIFRDVFIPDGYAVKNEYLTKNIVITNDLAYILLPTDFGKWASCYNTRGSEWDKVKRFFSNMLDIKIAVFIDDYNKHVVKGVCRPRILARCFIYKTESNNYVYGKVYSNDWAYRDALEKELLKAKVCRSCKNGICNNKLNKIPASVPYLDDLKYNSNKNELTFS